MSEPPCIVFLNQKDWLILHRGPTSSMLTSSLFAWPENFELIRQKAIRWTQLPSSLVTNPSGAGFRQLWFWNLADGVRCVRLGKYVVTPLRNNRFWSKTLLACSCKLYSRYQSETWARAHFPLCLSTGQRFYLIGPFVWQMEQAKPKLICNQIKVDLLTFIIVMSDAVHLCCLYATTILLTLFLTF